MQEIGAKIREKPLEAGLTAQGYSERKDEMECGRV